MPLDPHMREKFSQAHACPEAGVRKKCTLWGVFPELGIGFSLPIALFVFHFSEFGKICQPLPIQKADFPAFH